MDQEITKVERINLIIEEELDVLKLSLGEQFAIIWGWFWRSFLLMLAIGSISSGAGYMIGFSGNLIADVLNVDLVQSQIYISVIAGIAGFCIGLYSIAFFIKWVTQRNIGDFRFVLIRKI